MAKQKNTEFSVSLLGVFSQQLGMLISGGMPLSSAVELIADSFPDESNRLKLVSEDIYNGLSLSEALEKSGLFPKHYTNAVAVGERSGRTEETLLNLKSYYETNDELYSAAAYALKYPVMISLVFIAVVIALLAFVLPVFAGVYESLGANMGGVMLGLLNIGVFIRGNIFIFGALFAVLFFFTAFFLSQGKNASLIDKLVYSGKASNLRALADFFTYFALLVKSGFETDTAIGVAGENSDNQELKEKLESVLKLTKKGESTADAMRQTKLIEPVYCGMLETGIKTGNLDIASDAVSKRLVAQVYENAEKNITVIEPVAISAICIFVGLLLLCVMLPLVNIMMSI